MGGLGLSKGKTYTRKALLAKCKGDKNKEKELIKKLTDASIFVRAAKPEEEKAKAQATEKNTTVLKKPAAIIITAQAKPKALVAPPKPKVLKVATEKNTVLKKPAAVIVTVTVKKPAGVPVEKPAPVMRSTPGVATIHIPPKEGDAERYMVMSLPHLG